MAVTAVMHLLFLVAFFWMLVEGLLLWSKVVAVSMRPGPRMPLYYATGWGEGPLPLTLVLFPSTLPCMALLCPTPTAPCPPPSHTHLLHQHPAPPGAQHPCLDTNSAPSTSNSTQLQFLILLHFNHLLASSTASLIWDQLSP